MKQAEALKQLKSLDSKALAKELAVSDKKLVELKFSAKMRKLKNYKEITRERKKIAQIWTILGEKATEEIIKNTELKEVVNAK